jgi:hypothetical protein
LSQLPQSSSRLPPHPSVGLSIPLFQTTKARG